MVESDLLPLREVGLDDTQILEVVQICGYFNYINRVAHALGVPKEPGCPGECAVPPAVPDAVPKR